MAFSQYDEYEKLESLKEELRKRKRESSKRARYIMDEMEGDEGVISRIDSLKNLIESENAWTGPAEMSFMNFLDRVRNDAAQVLSEMETARSTVWDEYSAKIDAVREQMDNLKNEMGLDARIYTGIDELGARMEDALPSFLKQ